MVKRACAYCGKEFNANVPHRQSCKSCRTAVCTICGKKFEDKPFRVAAENLAVVCSIKCMNVRHSQMPNVNYLSQSQQDYIIANYVDISPEALAKKFGVKRRTITYYISKLRKQGKIVERANTVRRKRREAYIQSCGKYIHDNYQTMSDDEIAKATGIARRDVYKYRSANALYRFDRGHNEITYDISEEGCHICTSHKGPNGYPFLRRKVDKWKYPVARYVYENLHGELPSNVRLYRKCKNKECINPEHMMVSKRPFGKRPRRKITNKET